MAILKDIDQMIRTATQSCVYGTFAQTFDPKEFEREREDGTTILDLNPDCRVFIGGAEVTADVNSVSINNSMEGSACTISLNNPRGKYEISKMDLMKRWREDKDILAAYAYPELKKQDPLNYDKLAQKLGGSILGSGGGALVGQAIDMTKKIVDTLGGLAQGIPQSRGVTRMLFETKFYSGITRKAGDVVFDYRDPVFVFMKGRFSPFWYFTFTGIVISYSDEDAYGESNLLTLNCEDTASLWKRTKFSTKGSFFAMSNIEGRILNSNTSTKAVPFGDPSANLTFTNMLKVVAFTYDYGLRTKNCFPESVFNVVIPGASKKENVTDTGGSSDSQYDTYLEKIRKQVGIGKTFKLTDSSFLESMLSRVVQESPGVKSMDDLNYTINGETFSGGPNKNFFSAANSIYFQYNEIEYPSGKFDGKTISKLFDLSVRLWECKHDVISSLIDEYSGTGWADNKYFGICGNHPAMKYNFIDNFNMLERIWSLQYRYKTENLQKLKLTLYDKIYETVVGSPTELSPKGTKITLPDGSNFNFFRPRLFVILPQKYAGLRKITGDFSNLGKIDSESATNVWDYLKGALKPLEYNFYCSPCGDLYVEPELYDMHPIEFSNQIEPRSIFLKKESVELRNTSSTIPSDNPQEKPGSDVQPNSGTTVSVKVEHQAYFYNPKGSHPFFIMEKDRIRNTQEFSADNIVSSVSVEGSITDEGGIVEGAARKDAASLIHMSTSIAQGNSKKVTDANRFINGRYVADGFQNFMSDPAARRMFDENMAAYNLKYENYKKLVFIQVVSQINIDLRTFIKNFINGILYLNGQKDIQWNSGMVLDIIKELQNLGVTKEDVDYDIDVYVHIFSKYCSNIRTALKIPAGEIPGSVLTDIIDNKYIRDLLYKQARTKSGIDSNIQANNNFVQALSTYGQKNNESPPTSGDTGESYLKEDTFQLLQAYTATGLFNLDGKTDSSSIMGDTKSIVLNLITLQEPASLRFNDEIRDLYKDIQKMRESSYLPREMRAVTIADLIKLKNQGAYDPRTDLIKLYGYRVGEPIKNDYIKNGIEAVTYSQAVFNRLLGEAYSMNVVFIGRPELWLNRPYFLERKDCIGLCKNYSISYSYGGDFQSTILLTYIRKNSLSYAYSVEDLDVVVGDHNNSYFYSQGRLYLQLQEAIQKQGTAANKYFGGLISQSTKGNAGKITGEIASGLGNDALSYLKVGGLFVVNDVLGHMNYDARGGSNSAQVNDNSQGSKDVLYPTQGKEYITSIATEIKTNLETVENLLKDIELCNKDIVASTKSLVASNKKLTTEEAKEATADRACNIVSIKEEIKDSNEALASNKIKLKTINSNITKMCANILYSPALKDKDKFVYTSSGFCSSGKNDKFLTNALQLLYAYDLGGNPMRHGLYYKLFVYYIKDTGKDYKNLKVTTKITGNFLNNVIL